MKAEKIIRLRMQNSTFCRRIPVVQGDTARTFRFILEDITLDGTEHARIYARKPSGAEIYDECEVVGSNEVIFTPETEQIFIETGIILAEIRVAKGEKLITSYSFEFEVRQSTMRTGDIPSSDEFNALERAIEEAKGLHEPEFTEAGKRENIVSGETMQILFGKIKKWFTDLGALITKIGNKDISSIGDGTVTGAITDLDKRSTKNTSDIDVERKRIDNIAKLPEGSTAGDAELADIRVAADGTSYDTAGESVRGQINQIDQKYEKETSSLKEDLGDIRDVEYSRNMFDVSAFVENKEILADGTLIDSRNKVGVTDFIKVESGKSVYFSNNGIALQSNTLYFIVEFDSNKRGLRKLTTTDANYVYEVGDTVEYIRCVVKNSIISTLQIEYDEITPYVPYSKEMIVKGKNIDAINEEISNIHKKINNITDVETSKNLFDIAKAKNDTAYSSNGEYYAKNYMLSDFIPVELGKTIFSSVNGIAKQMNFVNTFNKSKAFIRNLEYQDTFTVTGNVAFIRVCYFGSTTTFAELQIEYDEITPFKPYGLKKINLIGDNITEMSNDISNLKIKCSSVYNLSDNPLSRINDCPELLSCFLNVGCIGDSLASGVSVYKDSNGDLVVNSVNRYPYSWGKFLERMTGNNYYNWSSGGLRTDTWLKSSYATECFDGNHLCQAYIIGLGQNDNNANKGSDIGTSADIDISDYNNNANTFYGRYAKIIQKIKEVQPKAKIFVITDPNDSVDANGYNIAIRTIADMFSNVYLIDMRTYWNYAPCVTLLNNQKRYGHFNAVGYFLIAKMMMTYIDWIMQKNWKDFREIENIGTDWYYYDELK